MKKEKLLKEYYEELDRKKFSKGTLDMPSEMVDDFGKKRRQKVSEEFA